MKQVKVMEGKKMSSGSSSSGASDVSSKSVVVGVDEDLLQLMDQLSGMQSKLEIVPIVGMGGVGKTTLAFMAREKQKFKILMFPWLAHGHITPFFQLSKRLSKTHHFTIYLCSTIVNPNSIKSSLSEDDAASLKLVELKMPSTTELPPHLHTTKNLPSDLIPTLIQAFQESSSSFSQIMDDVKPDLLIYDILQPWAPKIASSKGIPSVIFATSGASAISFLHHLSTMKSVATFPSPALNLPKEEFPTMKNHARVKIKDAEDDYLFGSYRLSTDIALVKSCRDVEEKYVDYLSVLCKKRIVCTGPLIADADERDSFESSEIMQWLNGKNHGSTLYISFGSECFLSKQQIKEIAKGLLLCDANFLWVVRFPLEERERRIEEELPEGFLEMVKGRGLVVTRWAPQTKILGHGSIGGFVSHCGWSSITESMYFGVPIIGMPMNTEQPWNALLMVELGTGVKVKKDVAKGLYVGEEVAKAMNEVMVEKEFYEGLRSEARRLSEVMKEKEEHEGNEAAEQLLKICVKYKN